MDHPARFAARPTAPPRRDADDLTCPGTEPPVDQRPRPFEVVAQLRKAASDDLPRAHDRSAMNAAQPVRPTSLRAPRNVSVESIIVRILEI